MSDDLETSRPSRRASAAHALRAGAITLAISSASILSPLLTGPTPAGKYLVAFGFFGACLGLSFLLHGGWDWWRGRRP